MNRTVARRRALAPLLVSVVALLLAGLVSSPAAAAPPGPPASSAPLALTANGLVGPVDVEVGAPPRLAWQVPGRDQAAYQVQLFASGGDSPLWDTGRVESTDQAVAYGGPALEAEEGYSWRVRVWDYRGVDTAWSQPASLGTGPGGDWGDATPVWAPAPTAWTDYTVETTLRVTAVAGALVFRARDGSNYLMWQFRASNASPNPNTLVPHTRVNGTFTALPAVPLGGALALNTDYAVKIQVSGPTVTTWFDGRQIDSRTVPSFPSGTIGVRTGGSERFELDDLAVTAPSGATLYRNDFAAPSTDLPCGSVTGGRLAVATGQDCRLATESADWSFLRGEVALADKDVAWAHVYATGRSPEPARQYVYKLWLNGEFVGLGPTRSIGGEVRYDGYDVTDLVQAGDNAFGALAYTTSDQRFLARLVVRYADGSTQTFGTGGGWTAMRGSSVFPAAGSIGVSNYFVAPKENLQAARYPTGFDRPGFDDSAWLPATVKAPFTRLVSTPTAKVEQQLREPVSVEEISPGSYRIDYGRSWIGGLSLDLTGTAGQRVDIRFGEVRNANGSVRYAMSTGNNYQDVWTLREGEQHLETWGMRVFRYVDVLGAPPGLTAEDFPALALVYPFDTEEAVFDSSSEALNQVWELSRNSIEALNLNMYADSYTRERDNYEADAYLQQLAHLFTSSDATLGGYSMDYFTEGRRTWPTEWPLYVILGHHDAWKQTGDTTYLEANYTDLQSKLPTRWLDPSSGLIVKTTGTNCNSQTNCDIVDWPTSQRDGYVFSSVNTVLNALSYRTYVDMAEIAAALGKDGDAETYRGIAERLRTAINTHLWDDAKGAYRDGRDGSSRTHYAVHATAFATAFGIPATAEQAGRAADYIESRGMACSVYCAGFLLQALYDGDRGDAGFDLLTSTGIHSWLNMIKQGAGATMEAWDLAEKSNTTYSHPWAAAPAYTVPRDLFGIRPTTPGFATFDVRPQADGLAWATVTVPTPFGRVGAAFEVTDGRTDIGISVPSGTRTAVYVPSTDTDAQVYLDGVPVDSEADKGYLRVDDVRSGCHVLSTAPGEVPQRSDRLTSVCAGGFVARDDAPPTVRTTVTPAASNGWTGPASTLRVEAEDAGGVSSLEYRIADGGWTEYTEPVALEDGEYDVAVRAVDGERNAVEETVAVRADGTAPRSSADVVRNARAPGGPATVTLTAEDATSGVGAIEYAVDGGAWTAYTGPFDSKGSSRTVLVRATDGAGNVEEARTVDVSPPGEPNGPR